VLATFVVTSCTLAWAYLRQQLHAWRSREPKGEPAPADSRA
jgi:hypothetical protein